MQLDWITVAAQIVNFLILVWLLNRFLYGPITRAMQRREEQIQDRLDKAKQQKEKAEAKQREFEDKLAEIEAAREDKLEQAQAEADDLKHKLEREARADVDEKREAWLAELQGTQDAFIANLRREIAGGFRDLADDALASLADTTLTERLADVLAERLKSLNGERRERLRSAIEKTDELVVETSDALDANTKRKLTRAIHDGVDEAVEVSYEETSDDLVGIRLRAGNVHLEWTLDAHLDQFAERLIAVFPERTRKEKDPTEGDSAKPPSKAPQAREDGRPVEATHE